MTNYFAAPCVRGAWTVNGSLLQHIYTVSQKKDSTQPPTNRTTIVEIIVGIPFLRHSAYQEAQLSLRDHIMTHQKSIFCADLSAQNQRL